MGTSQHINRSPVLTRKQEQVLIAGYFEPNGSSDPAVVYGPGVSSVKHTATGVWTITLDDSYYEVISAVLTLQSHSLQDVKLQLGDTVDKAQSTNATLKINAYTNNNAGSFEAPTAVDIANSAGHAGNRVHFQILMARRSL